MIVLTTFDLDEYAFAAIRAGAAAFLLKDAAPADLLGAIRAVMAGRRRRRAPHHPAAARRTSPPLPDPAADGDATGLAPLTERELEVLTLIARGLPTPRSPSTVVAEATVKTHVGRMLAKPARATASSSSCSPTRRPRHRLTAPGGATPGSLRLSSARRPPAPNRASSAAKSADPTSSPGRTTTRGCDRGPTPSSPGADDQEADPRRALSP